MNTYIMIIMVLLIVIIMLLWLTKHQEEVIKNLNWRDEVYAGAVEELNKKIDNDEFICNEYENLIKKDDILIEKLNCTIRTLRNDRW